MLNNEQDTRPRAQVLAEVATEEVVTQNGRRNGHTNGHLKNGKAIRVQDPDRIPDETTLFEGRTRRAVTREHPLATIAQEIRNELSLFILSQLREDFPIGLRAPKGEQIKPDRLLEVCRDAQQKLEHMVERHETTPQGIETQVYASSMQARVEEFLLFLYSEKAVQGISENERMGVAAQCTAFKEMMTKFMLQFRAISQGMSIQ